MGPDFLYVALRVSSMMPPMTAANMEPNRIPALAWSLWGLPMAKLSSATSRDTVKPIPATNEMPNMSVQV